MTQRILTTLGAGRLIALALVAGIAVGALVAVPLFAAASGDADPPTGDAANRSPERGALFDGLSVGSLFTDTTDWSATPRFGFGGRSEAQLDSSYEASGEDGISFSFEAVFGDGEPIRLGGNLIEEIAELTGTSEDDVAAAIADGQTLAEYAADHGVSADELVDALIGDTEERIAEAVERGDLSQETADRMLIEVREHLGALVNGEGFAAGGGFPFGLPGAFGFFDEWAEPGGELLLEFDLLANVAELTDTTEADVIAAVRDGATLAEFAAEHGVAEDELIDALLAGARERTAEAVTSGDLTQAEADELLARLEEHTRSLVNGEGFGFGRHFGPFGEGGFGYPFAPGGCDDSDDGEATSNQI